MEDRVKCYICGTEFDRSDDDCCPYCGWFYLGFENTLDEDEYEEINLTTITKAKENVKKGLDVWGELIKKK